MQGRERAAAEAHQCADVPSIPAEAARLWRRHAPQGVGFVVHDGVEGEQAVDAQCGQRRRGYLPKAAAAAVAAAAAARGAERVGG